MHGDRGDRPAIHGMLLVGEDTPYLSHLPKFASPHYYQAIFEVSLGTHAFFGLAPKIQRV